MTFDEAVDALGKQMFGPETDELTFWFERRSKDFHFQMHLDDDGKPVIQSRPRDWRKPAWSEPYPPNTHDKNAEWAIDGIPF